MDFRWILPLLTYLQYSHEEYSGTGKFHVVHSPQCTRFQDSASPVNIRDIPGVVLANLGVPLNKDIEWNGLLEGNLFQRPKAVALFSVMTGKEENLQLNGVQHSYTMNHDGSDVGVDEIIESIERLNWDNEPFTLDYFAYLMSVNLRASYPDMFKDIPDSLESLTFDGDWLSASTLGSLNLTQETDLRFVAELYVISKITNQLGDNRKKVLTLNSPDFIHFTISGLPLISSQYGKDSTQAADAKRLLLKVIDKVSREIRGIYHDNVVVELVSLAPGSTDNVIMRKTRSLQETTDTASNTSSLNLAPQFSSYYASSFNIILWTSIGLSLTVFFVSWAMWNMDPGRDSVIYRITSQRMKRE